MNPAEAKAMFLRLWKSKGERVLLRKTDFDGNDKTCSVRAVVSGFKPEELASGVEAGDRRVLAFADDVTTDYGTVENGDFAVLREGTADERTLFVSEPDTSTHRLAGVLVAVSFRAAGAA